MAPARLHVSEAATECALLCPRLENPSAREQEERGIGSRDGGVNRGHETEGGVLRRDVYTKATRADQAVRKVVTWAPTSTK